MEEDEEDISQAGGLCKRCGRVQFLRQRAMTATV